ncbi:MAG: disulfide bond formation protein B [Rubrivivax sp.]
MGPGHSLGAVALLALAGVAAALVSQHLFDMQPCAWCVLQRLLFLLIALVALAGLLRREPALRVSASAAVVALALAGVGAALWQHLVAAASPSCRLTLADRIVSGLGLDALLPDVFAARASCAEASVSMLGVPYALWSLALFVLTAALAASAAAGTLRR